MRWCNSHYVILIISCLRGAQAGDYFYGRFSETVFKEACRNMDIDEAGPTLGEDFLAIAKAASSKDDFYSRLAGDPVFSKLTNSVTFVGRSSSRDKHNATPDYPRAIGYGGRMIVASTDHPHPVDRDQSHLVEGIAYTSKVMNVAGAQLAAHKNHFFTIDYSVSPPQIELPAQDCQRCHAGRFNWETYNNWPGALESKNAYTEKMAPFVLDERAVKRKLVEALANKYLNELSPDFAPQIFDRGLADIAPKVYAEQSDDPIVNAAINALKWTGLKFDPQQKSWTEDRAVKRELEGIYRHFAYASNDGGNRELNEFIDSLTYDRMNADLRSLDSFERLKVAALAGVMDCGDATDFVGSKTNQELGGQPRFAALSLEIENQISAQYAEKEKIMRTFDDREGLNKPDLDDIRRLANLQYLFEGEKFKLGRYSSNFFGRKKNGVSYGFAHIGAGSLGANQLMCILGPEVVDQNPELHAYFGSEKVVDDYRSHNEGRPVCDALKKISMARAP